MENIDKLIAKHILGTTNQTEESQLQEWREVHAGNEEAFQSMLAYLKGKRSEMGKERPLFKDYINVQLAVQEALQTKEIDLYSRQREASKNKWRFWVVAASVAFILFFAISYQIDRQLSSVESAQNASTDWVEKKAAYGQKLAFILADGTKVQLNSGSTLTFPSKFGADKRTVMLEGEAFFEVKRDTLRPFVISSNTLKTTVLGTSFNVKAYPENQEVNVAVIEGKVRIEGEGANQKAGAVILQKNEMGTYSPQKATIKKSDFDPLAILGWTKQTIVFKNASFPEIIKTLEKWYGVEFLIRKKIKIEKGYNGVFENEPLATVLESMSYSIDFSYELKKEGKVVELK